MNGVSKESKSESRWPVVITMLVLLGLLATSSDRIRIVPVWALFLIVVLETIPLVGVALTNERPGWLRAERIITLFFCVITLTLNLANLTNIIRLTLYGSGLVNGVELLVSGIGVWIGNVGSCSLLFWLVDRGGPHGRAIHKRVRPDWLFPQEGAPKEDSPVGWKPEFVDYLFLGYCTATAFSPTDTLPLTHRAKFLVMFECSVSLLTILVVLSRSVNILS